MKRTRRPEAGGAKTAGGEKRPIRNASPKLASAKDNMCNFDLAIKKYGGSLRKSFLARGYTSVDEYINEIRGRNAEGELDVPGPYG